MRWLNFRLIFTVLVITLLPGTAQSINLRPDAVTLQFGGGMGLPSVGVDWKYGAGQRFETELGVGLIPKYDSSCAKASFTIKENFVPWHIDLSSRFNLEPLSVSLYFTTVLSGKFWMKQPSRYQPGYYRLPTQVRANLSIGQRVSYKIPSEHLVVKAVSAFYELATCDIYLLSAFGNSSLSPADWLMLTLGIKLNF